MAKKKKKSHRQKENSFFKTVKQKAIDFKNLYWQRQIIVRTVSLITAMVLLLFGGAWGFNHQAKVQMDRAMRVSDTNQQLEFSKTGSEVKLDPQKRNKNMAVIPIQFTDSENMSLNAKDYKVFLKSSDKNELPSDISASFVIFGTTKEAAIVLRGHLEKQPMQIVLRNDKNYETTDEGENTIMLDGKEQEVDYNAIAFTVNPKGDNVKVDNRIQPNMSMPDLFSTTLGDRQLKSLDHDQKIGEDQLHKSQDKLKEEERQINQLNKALGRKQNDFKLNDGADTDSDDTNGIIDNNSNDLDKLDLSSADMESLRNTLINQRSTIKDEISQAKSNLRGVDNQRKEVKSTTQSMDSLVSISNDYDVVE